MAFYRVSGAATMLNDEDLRFFHGRKFSTFLVWLVTNPSTRTVARGKVQNSITAKCGRNANCAVIKFIENEIESNQGVVAEAYGDTGWSHFPVLTDFASPKFEIAPNLRPLEHAVRFRRNFLLWINNLRVSTSSL
jgi:hypothetical protein